MEQQSELTIGEGVTLCVGSDKYPYTISKYEKGILTIQSDTQNGSVESFKKYKNKNGSENWYKVELNTNTNRYNKKRIAWLKFGVREHYIDPSF